MAEYSYTGTCPKCGFIVEDVDISTKFPPWFALCNKCGALVTKENLVRKEKENG